MATSWTAADVAKLERAIRTGASTVKYDNGRQVTYRSLAEMFALLEQVKGQVDPSQAGPLRKVMANSKGIQAGGLGRDGREFQTE